MGTLNWSRKLKYWNDELSYNNDIILVGVEDELKCISKDSGQINWKNKVNEGVILETRLNDNKCWVIVANKVVEYDVVTGNLLNKWDIGVENIDNAIIKSAYFKEEILYLIFSGTQNVDFLMAYNYIQNKVLWKREVYNNGKYLFNSLTVIDSIIILTARYAKTTKTFIF